MLKKIVNFYIYSSLHIAICAVMLAISTFRFYNLPIDLYYLIFLGTGTITTYSLHRLIGIAKSSSFQNKGRFAIVQDYKFHIFIYTVLSMIISIWIFLDFDTSRQIRLIILSLISLLYVLPIFGNGRRLRDINYIKIGLVGLVWTCITVTSILLESDIPYDQMAIHSFVVLLYIIGITIPFDVRDQSLDRENGVKTIATKYSLSTVKTVTYTILTIAAISTWFLLETSINHKLIWIATFISSSIIIHISWGEKNDYWYSGLLDGTMTLPILFEWIIKIID